MGAILGRDDNLLQVGLDAQEARHLAELTGETGGLCPVEAKLFAVVGFNCLTKLLTWPPGTAPEKRQNYTDLAAEKRETTAISQQSVGLSEMGQ